MSKTVYIGHAVGDEHHKSKGGEAGNQGDELRKSKWYLNSKGWRCFRAPKNAKLIADDMRYAIANKNIGYDQSQRNTLWNAAAKVGYNCSLVAVPCETDCSALVRVCIAYAGYVTPNFNTVSEPTRLLSAGFIEMIGEKYTTMPDYLCEGDILVTKTKGHTVVVLNDGDKAHDEPTGKVVYVKGGSVYVRKGGSKEYKAIGVAHRGEEYPYIATSDTGWYEIDFHGNDGFISNKSTLTELR